MLTAVGEAVGIGVSVGIGTATSGVAVASAVGTLVALLVGTAEMSCELSNCASKSATISVKTTISVMTRLVCQRPELIGGYALLPFAERNCADVSGNSSEKTLPFPFSLSTHSRPPFAMVSECAMLNPTVVSPTPAIRGFSGL